MDELATAVNIDPVELRLINFAEADEDEKLPFSSKALRECYKQGAERFGWSRRNPKPASMREGKTLVGWGMATATYPANRQDSAAKVRLTADGRVVVSCAAHDLGTGTYTTLTQIAAETLGLPMKNVTVELADTVLPQAPVAGGSQTSASVGPAVKTACEHAIEALKTRAIADQASPLFGKDKEQIAVADGRIFLKQNLATGETFAELLRRNGGTTGGRFDRSSARRRCRGQAEGIIFQACVGSAVRGSANRSATWRDPRQPGGRQLCRRADPQRQDGRAAN